MILNSIQRQSLILPKTNTLREFQMRMLNLNYLNLAAYQSILAKTCSYNANLLYDLGALLHQRFLLFISTRKL